MPDLPVLRFKNDTALRRRFFVDGAMAHPAKGHIALWQEIIERYTSPGDTILDPMAGVGTTLVAALMGRNVICVELEPHFVEPMKASWEKLKQHPMLGHTLGEVLILQGDARALPLEGVDSAIFSPPYEGFTEANDEQRTHARATKKEVGDRLRFRGKSGYTRPAAIVTSPPYNQEVAHLPLHVGERPGLSHADKDERISDQRVGLNYSPNQTNMRGDTYWSAMRQVYSECHRVLRPQGILALVLKGFTRNGKYVDLPSQTRDLVESLGFWLFDHWRRELWSLSFWRILQKRRDPEAFDDRLNYEEVLAFKKVDGEGGGIQAAVFSPPYEGSVQSGEGPGASGEHPPVVAGQMVGYTRPSAVIMSPPYEDSPTSSGLGSVNKDDWGKEGTDIAARRGLQVGYTKRGTP